LLIGLHKSNNNKVVNLTSYFRYPLTRHRNDEADGTNI